jgi:hypothetical protein
MKVLKGQLQETLFAWPNQELVRSGEDSPPQVIRDRVYGENEVTYMSDQLGLHRISNPDPTNVAVSLHCKCHISDRLTEPMLTDRSIHPSQCGYVWLPHLR